MRATDAKAAGRRPQPASGPKLPRSGPIENVVVSPVRNLPPMPLAQGQKEGVGFELGGKGEPNCILSRLDAGTGS